MGARRDHDLTVSQRADIAIKVLAPDRPYGRITELAREHEVSRPTIYTIAVAGKQALLAGLEPGPHGPHPEAALIRVDRNRLVRGSVVLSEVGVSQRDVQVCLGELLDTPMSPSWVNAELAKVEQTAATINQTQQPCRAETKSGDEVYSNGLPNLLVVGNDSLYIYALTRQPTCDGETWGCVLLDVPACEQLSSDGGAGLAAGVQWAQIKWHQLDWDHLLRPQWGQAERLIQQAYATLTAVEERAVKVLAATTSKRLEQHWAVWEKLSAEAEEKMARADAFCGLAQQVDQEFALIDVATGLLRDPLAAADRLRRVGQQLQPWTGPIYQKLSSYLIHGATALFNYQPLLTQALTPLIERWGAPAIQALSRLWQIEADEKRHPHPLLERQSRQAAWEASLDQAAAVLGEHLWSAWAQLSNLLGRAWRGSSLAECVNGLLRPILAGRQHTDQGCLELFRFLHNARPFARGKRAKHSPAELAGLETPEDPLILLGLAPKV